MKTLLKNAWCTLSDRKSECVPHPTCHQVDAHRWQVLNPTRQQPRLCISMPKLPKCPIPASIKLSVVYIAHTYQPRFARSSSWQLRIPVSSFQGLGFRFSAGVTAVKCLLNSTGDVSGTEFDLVLWDLWVDLSVSIQISLHVFCSLSIQGAVGVNCDCCKTTMSILSQQKMEGYLSKRHCGSSQQLHELYECPGEMRQASAPWWLSRPHVLRPLLALGPMLQRHPNLAHPP